MSNTVITKPKLSIKDDNFCKDIALKPKTPAYKTYEKTIAKSNHKATLEVNSSKKLSKAKIQQGIAYYLQEIDVTNETVTPELKRIIFQNKDLTNKRQGIRDYMQYTGQLIDKHETKSINLHVMAKDRENNTVEELRRELLQRD